MAPLRVVFLGSDSIALPLLNWLAGEGSGVAQVVGVLTQPDKPVGRGQKVQPNAIKTWALERGLPVLQPEKLTSEVHATLASFSADVALVMAYGHILREEFIHTPRLGTLNLHTSLLPKYRGASPIQSAVASGDRETGVTLMRIVRKLDAGPVADVERIAIAELDTALEVEAKLAAACVPLLRRALSRLADGTLTFVEQDEAQATYCRKLEKEDGAVDFAAPAHALAARINGLFPWPASSLELNGQLVKLGLADVADDTSNVAGGHDRVDVDGGRDGVHVAGVRRPRSVAVSDTDNTPKQPASSSFAGPTEDKAKASYTNAGAVLGADADGLLVQCREGVVRFRRLQRPGGKMLAAAEFLRGFGIAAGTVIPSHPMPPLVAPTPFRPQAKR